MLHLQSDLIVVALAFDLEWKAVRVTPRIEWTYRGADESHIIDMLWFHGVVVVTCGIGSSVLNGDTDDFFRQV